MLRCYLKVDRPQSYNGMFTKYVNPISAIISLISLTVKDIRQTQ